MSIPQMVQARLFARLDAPASWTKVVLGAPGAGEVQAVRVDGGPVSLAGLPALLTVEVQNRDAAAPCYWTATDPGGGGVALGEQVSAGGTSGVIDLGGTGSPVELWVYGDAALPPVQVILTLTSRR